MIMNMLQYSIHYCGFLMLVSLRWMPNVLQGAWWSQSWHHVIACCIQLLNQIISLGYWLFYFSSVLFWLRWGKKTFAGKRLSQVSMYVALFTLACIGGSQYLWQSVNIDRNCDVLPIKYDLLIVMFVNINITITIIVFFWTNKMSCHQQYVTFQSFACVLF